MQKNESKVQIFGSLRIFVSVFVWGWFGWIQNWKNFFSSKWKEIYLVRGERTDFYLNQIELWMKNCQHLTKRTEEPKYLTKRVEWIIFPQKFRSVYTKHKYVVHVRANVNWTQQVKFVKNQQIWAFIYNLNVGFSFKSWCK